jgi:hypothetical protein
VVLLGEHHGDKFQQQLHYDDHDVGPIYHFHHDVTGPQSDVLHDDLHV